MVVQDVLQDEMARPENSKVFTLLDTALGRRYNPNMNDASQRKPASALTVFLLAVGTTLLACGLIGHALYRSISTPRTVSGPMKNGGWGFTIVAMDGARPVRLVHEWSGLVSGYYLHTSSPKSRANKSVARAQMESRAQLPIVWADTGRASIPLRYYFTKTDLLKANSQFENADPADWRSVRVEAIDDDPMGKRQTIEVTESTEKDDVTSVYRVEGERVRPVAWSRVRPMAVGIQAFLVSPVILVISILIWRSLLRRLRS